MPVAAGVLVDVWNRHRDFEIARKARAFCDSVKPGEDGKSVAARAIAAGADSAEIVEGGRSPAVMINFLPSHAWRG
jgi:hypothetical protein